MNGTNMARLAVPLLGLALCPAAVLAGNLSEGCQGTGMEVPIMDTPNADRPEHLTGTASLCAEQTGMRCEINAGNLKPGYAYTAWWVYVDFQSPSEGGPPFVVGRLDSGMPTGNTFTFSGHVNDLRASPGSEIRIVIVAHGPANTTNNLVRARQVLTPEEPALGTPYLGFPPPKGFDTAVAIFAFE